MAIAKDIISQGLSGAIGKELVFKIYDDKTVVTKFPNMKNIVPSAAKKISEINLKKHTIMLKKLMTTQ